MPTLVRGEGEENAFVLFVLLPVQCRPPCVSCVPCVVCVLRVLVSCASILLSFVLVLLVFVCALFFRLFQALLFPPRLFEPSDDFATGTMGGNGSNGVLVCVAHNMNDAASFAFCFSVLFCLLSLHQAENAKIYKQ